MRANLILICLLIAGCSTLPKNVVKTKTTAIYNTQNTSLGLYVNKLLNKNNNSQMYLLDEGLGAFFARKLLIDKAMSSIDVQYFIWRADLVGKLMFYALLCSADKGVRVRILLDDISIDNQVLKIITALDQHKNISVSVYNPFSSRLFRFKDFIFDWHRLNRRMHNKSFTVDAQVTIVGGRNIGNGYFSANENSNFSDIDVMAIGPIVKDIETQFDAYWNSKVVVPISHFKYNQATVEDLNILRLQLNKFYKSQQISKYVQDIKSSTAYQYWNNIKKVKTDNMLFTGKAKAIYDDPGKGLSAKQINVTYLKSLLEPHIHQIKSSLEIISPYFVPGLEGTKQLISLVKKGIKVRVITNSLSSTDGVMAQSGYAKRRLELLKGGIEIYELKSNAKSKYNMALKMSGKSKKALHAKVYIFDRKEVFIGSFNFDLRSANINSEVGVIYQIPNMAYQIAHKRFDIDIDKFTYQVKLQKIKTKRRNKLSHANVITWIDKKNKKYYTTNPDTSIWRKLLESFFEILPIESQL